LKNAAAFPPQGLYCHDIVIRSLVCEYRLHKPLEDDKGRNSSYLVTFTHSSKPGFELRTFRIRGSYAEKIINL
jgi:hypothetical protein